MKKVFLFAAIAALFAACSSKDEVVKDDIQQPQLENGAIGFDVYTQKATTRAGWAGLLNTGALQENGDGKANGFGVFGFYTDNNEYDQRSVPNFMYNQQVTWSGSVWQYEPLMYWPNEYGSNAISDDQDKVSFFAYAPYVEVIPTSGKIVGADADKSLEQWGITGMTRNSNQGDPILKYIASFDKDKSVDLCWGVAPNAEWNITQTGTDQNIKAGYPWLDVERPANTNQKVKFIFKHATAQMQINIDADVNVDGHGHNNVVDAKTRVWVRQITFKGFAMKGSLNLNNDDPSDAEKPKWLDYNGQNEIVAEDITIYDGRKDGKEGVLGAVATNEKSLGLNARLIQDEPYAGASWPDPSSPNNTVYNAPSLAGKPGVTNVTVPLFENGGIFHVIPTDDAFEVEIVYDIETVDPNLAQNLSDNTTKGSSIENRISKQIKFGSDATNTFTTLKPGHSYKLDLHLGLNSVEFDATVSEWLKEAPQDVDLPLNIPAFVAKTTPASGAAYNVTLPYTGSYTFAMTGLDGGESVSSDPATINIDGQTWTLTTANANTSGVAIQTLTTVANPKTVNRQQVVTLTGAQSSKGVQMTFTQQAHPLFLAITGFANNGDGRGVITLKRHDSEAHEAIPTNWTAKTGWLCDNDVATELTDNGNPDAATPTKGIAVYRNGKELTWKKDALTADADYGMYNFKNTSDAANEYTNTITIGDALQPGDVIKVYLKTGDAPLEVVSAVVGGISYAPATRTVVYRESATTYNVKPNYIGSTTSPSISYTSSVDAVVASSASENVSVKKAGETEITATLSSTNPFDAITTSKLTLNVIKQDSYIKDETMKSEDLGELSKAAGTTVKDLSSAKANGVLDQDHGITDFSISLVSATKDGAPITVGNFFVEDGGAIKVKDAVELTVGSTYTVTVTGTSNGETDKYNGCSKTVIYTFKAKEP